MSKIVDIVSQLSLVLGQWEEAAKEQYGFAELTTTQMHYIEVVSRLGNPSATELAEQLRLSKPTVTVGLARLIERGYVCRVRSDDDRRTAHLHLTPKGELINRMHEEVHRRFARRVAESMSASQVEELERLLGKINFD